MDLLLRITFASGCKEVDQELARRWLAEQIRFFTGLAVAGYADAVHPASTFEVAALEYVDVEQPTGGTEWSP
ncbi:hypothetical protein AB0K51_27075 [Kitasatospora sp. NPDC049285]|uniref:hypothetical protein n=1 Tax=Kitasatospora sp. NPDC049285 TaxID=3157096 RepID=UPI00341837D8